MTRFKPTTMMLVMLLAMTGIAIASGGTHFKSSSDSVGANNDLFVSFDEVGAGAGPIHYTVTATASATYCTAPSSESGSFDTDTVHNNVIVSGKDTGVGPPAPGAAGALASVSYSSVVLTDTNNSVPITLANVSKTVSTCP